MLNVLTAGSIMTDHMVTIPPDASIEDAIELILTHEVSGLPVVDDDGRLVGVITEFALLAVAYDQKIKDQLVSQHMTREIISVEPDDVLGRVADLCIVHRVRRLPVMKDGRLVGLIARRDVLRAIRGAAVPACLG